MNQQNSRWWPVVLVLCLGTAVGLAQQQQPRPREDKKPEKKEDQRPAKKDDKQKTVEIQVWGIRATTKNKDIAVDLKDMADKLKDFKYTGFKLEQRQPGPATALGKPFTTMLTGNYQVKVTPQKVEDKRVTMRIEVTQGKESKLSTTVTVDAGKYQLQGGWPLDGGDALIVAVSAR
jgi:hypothetical protein